MPFRLSNIDIRQLHIFQAVVECRGFTSAQAVLNIGQSTISTQMSQLEARLGIRLCERGRTGFELTAKGKRVYEEALKLFRAQEDFQNVTAELKGRLNGYLGIAVIDNVISDPICPIVRALNLFNKREHEVTIRMEIMTPGNIERALLDKAVDVAIGTFHNNVPGLDYRPIYVEKNELLCGRNHPLFLTKQPNEIKGLVKSARKVSREYLDKRDLFSLGVDETQATAVVENLEASAILILGGGHIGFLPRHYASQWLSKSEMRSILTEEFVYNSDFSLVTRKSPRRSMILKTFLADLSEAISSSADADGALLQRPPATAAD